jgi:hypothetical protein
MCHTTIGVHVVEMLTKQVVEILTKQVVDVRTNHAGTNHGRKPCT